MKLQQCFEKLQLANIYFKIVYALAIKNSNLQEIFKRMKKI